MPKNIYYNPKREDENVYEQIDATISSAQENVYQPVNKDKIINNEEETYKSLIYTDCATLNPKLFDKS